MLRQIAERHSADVDRVVFKNWQRNYEFHTYLYSLNNNVYGCEALQQMIHQCSRYISQYFLSAWQRKNESNGRYHSQRRNPNATFNEHVMSAGKTSVCAADIYFTQAINEDPACESRQ